MLSYYVSYVPGVALMNLLWCGIGIFYCMVKMSSVSGSWLAFVALI